MRQREWSWRRRVRRQGRTKRRTRSWRRRWKRGIRTKKEACIISWGRYCGGWGAQKRRSARLRQRRNFPTGFSGLQSRKKRGRKNEAARFFADAGRGVPGGAVGKNGAGSGGAHPIAECGAGLWI